MRSFTKFSLRFGAYALVLGYIAGDLYVFHGPLSRHMKTYNPDSPEAIAKAKANGVVARVFNHQITRRQLDFAIHERLWLEGKQLSDLNPEARKLITYASLGELIDHELIRVKAKVNTMELPVTDAEIEDRFKLFSSRFATKEQMESAMKSMDLTAKKTDFATLAKKLSDDSATKDKAGDLGWMSRSRLPVDFAESIFPLAKDSPTLIRTKLGWHIVVVTDRKAAEPRSLEECREEITAALRASKRHQAVIDFRTTLHRFEQEKIDIFHDRLGF